LAREQCAIQLTLRQYALVARGQRSTVVVGFDATQQG
jgi:hypothetical protein